MSQHEHWEAAWRVWRHARHSELTHPFGWSSLSAQHWLREGDHERVLESLPGTWSVRDGRIWHTPSATHTTEPAITVDGTPVTHTFEVTRGLTLVSGKHHPALILSGGREIETYARLTPAGEHAYAIRIRDPRHAATAHTLNLPAFDYDPAYRVSAQFTPHAETDMVRPTVIDGVVDVVPSIGRLRFSVANAEHTVTVFGQRTLEGITPFTHLRDATSAQLTHGNGRKLDLAFTDDTPQSIDVIDFNYLYTMPCAITEFVSCPLPLPENHLDVAILAGEQTPTVVRH